MNSEWPPGLSISHIPLRKVVRRSSAISNGTFRTYKHPDHGVTFMPAESPNELHFLRFAELDPNVTAIVGQPTELYPEVDGKVFRSTPDFAIMLGQAARLVEVKGSDAYAHLELRRKLAACERFTEFVGWTYCVVLGGDLLSSPIYEPVWTLWRYHRRTYDVLHLHSVQNFLRRRDAKVGTVVRALECALGAKAPRVGQVLSLAAGGKIFIDLDPRIEVGEESLIRLPDPAAAPPPLIPYRSPTADLGEST